MGNEASAEAVEFDGSPGRFGVDEKSGRCAFEARHAEPRYVEDETVEGTADVPTTNSVCAGWRT